MSEQYGNGNGGNSNRPPVVSESPLRARLVTPSFSSRELFGSSKELTIEHDDLIYRLRITKQGKLILNK